VFKAAGLPVCRKHGVVWHTLRHEFCSQMAELTDNIVEVKAPLATVTCRQLSAI